MPETSGFVPTLVWALVGGLVGESLRIARLMRQGHRPAGREIGGSAIYAVCGGFAVVLLGWNATNAIFVVMATGAGFPLIFEKAVDLITRKGWTPPDDDDLLAGQGALPRLSLVDYMSGRF